MVVWWPGGEPQTGVCMIFFSGGPSLGYSTLFWGTPPLFWGSSYQTLGLGAEGGFGKIKKKYTLEGRISETTGPILTN